MEVGRPTRSAGDPVFVPGEHSRYAGRSHRCGRLTSGGRPCCDPAGRRQRSGAIDANTRRSEYAAGGWDGFVAKDIWDEDIGSEDIDRLPPREREPALAPFR